MIGEGILVLTGLAGGAVYAALHGVFGAVAKAFATSEIAKVEAAAKAERAKAVTEYINLQLELSGVKAKASAELVSVKMDAELAIKNARAEFLHIADELKTAVEAFDASGQKEVGTFITKIKSVL